MKIKSKWIITAGLLLGATAQSEMITVGGDQTAGTGTITINQDITFNVTTAYSGGLFFVFDEIVTAHDGSYNEEFFEGLTFSVNAGPALAIQRWTDNVTFNNLDGTPNDGWFSVTANLPALAVDDIVTLHAGTGIMTSTQSLFNPWSSGDYDIFLSNTSISRISDNGVVSAVPEPATAGLLGISALVLFGIRRLKKSYGIR